MTNLLVNGVTVADDADNVHVQLQTAQEVKVNGTQVWQRTAILPDPITDFNATDDLPDFITCTWTIGSNTMATHLYNYDTQELIRANIISGYEWYGANPGVTYNLCIVVESIEGGKIISNVNSGTAGGSYAESTN